MAQASTQAYDYTPEEALRRIKAERTGRAWLAVFLFALSALALATGAYFSYRDLPAPPPPANNAPGIADP